MIMELNFPMKIRIAYNVLLSFFLFFFVELFFAGVADVWNCCVYLFGLCLFCNGEFGQNWKEKETVENITSKGSCWSIGASFSDVPFYFILFSCKLKKNLPALLRCREGGGKWTSRCNWAVSPFWIVKGSILLVCMSCCYYLFFVEWTR